MRERIGALLARARAARPALDHLIRTQGRMSATRGSMLAGSVTYAAFLSIGPLLLLAVSVLGFVLAGNVSAQQDVLVQFQKVIPGSLSQDLLTGVQNSRGATGVIGLVTAAISGLGWLNTLKTALQVVWHQDAVTQNAVLSRLQDALTLVGFAVLLVVSTALSTSATGLAKSLANTIVGSDAPGLSVVLTVVGLALAVVANQLLFLFVYQRLSVVNRPRRRFVQGSLISGVGVALLQSVLFFVIGRTLSSSSQTYGAAIGGVFALLLYIRYITLIMMYSAAWMSTAPYDDDVLPSGTALVALSDAEAAYALPTKRARAEDVRQEIALSMKGGEVALPSGGTAPRPAEEGPLEPVEGARQVDPTTSSPDGPRRPSGADDEVAPGRAATDGRTDGGTTADPAADLDGRDQGAPATVPLDVAELADGTSPRVSVAPPAALGGA